MPQTKAATRRKTPVKPRKATRDLLLDTAGLLLGEVGVERISTNLICERAGVTPPALYYYFADKFDVIVALGERLMAVLYEKLPQLKGQVDYVEFSTPLSTQYFNAYRYGELYGLNHDPQRFQQDWLRPRTRIQGLWLTGQDILSCGVAGALSSGLVTALNVAGPRLLPVLKQALGKSPA